MENNNLYINQTMELEDVKGRWFFDERWQVWCLEDILYTSRPTTPTFQRMSIFVPAAYMKASGEIDPAGRHGNYTAFNAPIVFENNAAGYMQMPHTWLGGPRDEAGKYLKRGMVYITCGCRGRESVDREGKLCGKSPWTLIDLKTAIRFLRHNHSSIPGNMDRMISVGWSAGGAMSSLIGVTGNHSDYNSYLEQNGAFMDEGDEVFAAQIYCPIIDLEHADLAYEWQFRNDPVQHGPDGISHELSDFQKALSGILAEKYVEYFNALGLRHPQTGEALTIGADGRSGSAYDFLMKALETSATEYLERLSHGDITMEHKEGGGTNLERHPVDWTVQDYLKGNEIRRVDVFPTPLPKGKEDPEERKRRATGLGEQLLRRRGEETGQQKWVQTRDRKGEDKTAWLSFAYGREGAHITSLEDYIANQCPRMKPCTSFDALEKDSGENHEFGTAETDYAHFNLQIAGAIEKLKDQYPTEYERYYRSFAAVAGDDELIRRVHLLNPMDYTEASATTGGTQHFRIQTGACDPHTSFMISLAFAVKLANAGRDVQYRLIWEQPHCEADYPGEVCDWIDALCGDPYAQAMALKREHRDAEAEPYLIQAAEQGRNEAIWQLGDGYLMGHFGKPDYEKAFYWSRIAAEKGSEKGATSLGILYRDGLAVEEDKQEARKWFERATEAGEMKAPRHLGNLYREGIDGMPDLKKAAAYYRIAAERGDITGQYELARCYETGEGVPRDMEQAAAWYRKSAERGDRIARPAMDALERLGIRQ